MTQIFKTTVLMAGLIGLFMLVGYLLGGQSGMLMALVLGCGMNLVMYWFSGSLVVKMQGAKPLSGKYPEVERIVTDLAQRDGLPMPKLYYVDTPIPNAFATGRSPAAAVVAVTSGIMEILTESELRAVLDGLGDVVGGDVFRSGQVGDGTRDLQDAVVGARA